MMDAIESAIPTPQVEIIVQCRARRQVFRNRSPLTAGRENVHQTVHHLAHDHRALVARMAKKLKLQESRVVISSERGLAAHRRLRFFERSVVPIVVRRANGGRRMEWARILAYITGTVDQDRSCCCGMSIWLLKTGS